MNVTIKLTPAQTAQLQRLADAKAFDRLTAVSVLDLAGLNPVVIGKLRDLGLADSRVRRPPGGSQRTDYWLTPDGAAAAGGIA